MTPAELRSSATFQTTNGRKRIDGRIENNESDRSQITVVFDEFSTLNVTEGSKIELRLGGPFKENGDYEQKPYEIPYEKAVELTPTTQQAQRPPERTVDLKHNNWVRARSNNTGTLEVEITPLVAMAARSRALRFTNAVVSSMTYRDYDQIVLRETQREQPVQRLANLWLIPGRGFFTISFSDLGWNGNESHVLMELITIDNDKNRQSVEQAITLRVISPDMQIQSPSTQPAMPATQPATTLPQQGP